MVLCILRIYLFEHFFGVIYICFKARDTVGFFRQNSYWHPRLVRQQPRLTSPTGSNGYISALVLHISGNSPTRKARKLHIFALTICSHTSLTWNWTSGCRTFFILCIVSFLGLLFAMLVIFGFWELKTEPVILYKTFHRKPKDALSSFYSGLITWCPRLSFIRKQLHNFLVYHTYRFFIWLSNWVTVNQRNWRGE